MTSDSDVVTRARYMLIISVVVTILLYKVPQLHVVAYPLLLISTLVHELGHGIAALFAGGSFHEFQMFSDGSGFARHSGNLGSFGQAFVAAGGLVGPAVGAALCFVFARRTSTARYCLGVIGLLLALAELLVVRNTFAFVFVGAFAAICLIIAFRGGKQLVQLGLVFLAVQLALSVYSRSDYLFTDVAHTATGVFPSDSQHIAEAMGFGTYWFWGGICAAFSALVLLGGAWFFLRRAR